MHKHVQAMYRVLLSPCARPTCRRRRACSGTVASSTGPGPPSRRSQHHTPHRLPPQSSHTAARCCLGGGGGFSISAHLLQTRLQTTGLQCYSGRYRYLLMKQDARTGRTPPTISREHGENSWVGDDGVRMYTRTRTYTHTHTHTHTHAHTHTHTLHSHRCLPDCHPEQRGT